MPYDANKSPFLFEVVMIRLFGSIKPVPNSLPKPSFFEKGSPFRIHQRNINLTFSGVFYIKRSRNEVL